MRPALLINDGNQQLAADTSLPERLKDAIGAVPRQGPQARSLRVDGIGKRYGETVALSGVTIDFTPGHVHTVLGENGSGKSTLLKLLSGIVQPSEGAILLDGQPIAPRSPAEMRRHGLATVFQEVLITPHRSVTENVLLGYDGMIERRMPASRREAAVAAMLGALSKTPIELDRPAGRLPLAVQQLIVIARALVHLPGILLLDEATAALDLGDRDRVFDVISEYARSGNVVIFISHRMDEVRRLSDRVSILRSGSLVETLERDDLTTERLLRLMAPEARLHA